MKDIVKAVINLSNWFGHFEKHSTALTHKTKAIQIKETCICKLV